jgi:hypothetical protein
MTRLDWNLPSTRTYERGIDRCVLYVSGKPGVAWPGLTRLEEIYSGVDANSNYMDGRKYRTTLGRANFRAKLSAFSAPEEFSTCVGALEIEPGLFAMNQPSQLFGLSYRTLIGNDVVGSDYGYKVHIIYNALATPGSFKNSTISDAPEAPTKQWTLDTIPHKERDYSYFRSGDDQTTLEHVETKYRPTSHMVVDTRAVGPHDIQLLEDVLYGTETTDPELPTPSELLELIS